MARLVLHLLLVFGLLLNGMSARSGEAHAHASAPSEHVASAMAGHAHHAGMHHASPSGGADAVDADTLAATQDHDCGGASCQCGCVVPPALPLVAGVSPPPPLTANPASPQVPMHVMHRSTAPFRPPAA